MNLSNALLTIELRQFLYEKLAKVLHWNNLFQVFENNTCMKNYKTVS